MLKNSEDSKGVLLVPKPYVKGVGSYIREVLDLGFYGTLYENESCGIQLCCIKTFTSKFCAWRISGFFTETFLDFCK